jgi:hypothetical protein
MTTLSTPGTSMLRFQMLDAMLGHRAAELEDFVRLLASWPPSDFQRLANRRPDLWVERFAELYPIAALAQRLPKLALLGLPMRPAGVCTNSRCRRLIDETSAPLQSVGVPQSSADAEIPVYPD